MNLKQITGEISRKDVIYVGNKVCVTYIEDGAQKEKTGILLNATEREIEINGEIPIAPIKVKNILRIEK